MCKNRYIGRTFIQPDQSMRDNSIRLKFNPLGANLRNKSIVADRRQHLRAAHAAADQTSEISWLQSCARAHQQPDTAHPCYMGVTSARTTRTGYTREHSGGYARYLGADSLAFLSVDGLNSSVVKGIDQPTRSKQGHKVGHCKRVLHRRLPAAATT